MLTGMSERDWDVALEVFRAAPFRANDEMLELDPVCVLTLANTLNAARGAELKPFGPAMNLAQKALERGLRHHPVKPRA